MNYFRLVLGKLGAVGRIDEMWFMESSDHLC